MLNKVSLVKLQLLKARNGVLPCIEEKYLVFWFACRTGWRALDSTAKKIVQEREILQVDKGKRLLCFKLVVSVCGGVH